MKELYKSIALFQQECPVILKDTQGFGYKYTDLPAIFAVINPLLKKHNLGFYQSVSNSQLKTVVFHVETAEQIEESADIPQGVKLAKMNDFQVLGSAITYMRRYQLSAMLGIVTDKDVDAYGEQETKKPFLTSKQFDDALIKFKDGKVTIDKIKEHYSLTKQQENDLKL